MKRPLLLLAALCCSLALLAQSPFQFTGTTTAGAAKSLTVDLDALRDALKQAPREFSGTKSDVTVSLPLPAGGFADYVVYNSPLQERYPEMGGYKLSGPWGGGRIAVSPTGMSAVLRGPAGYFIIEPRPEGNGYQVSSYGDVMRALEASQTNLSCGYDETDLPNYAEIELDEDFLAAGAQGPTGGFQKAGNEARELRVYDLIVTNTGEFGQRVGGTRAAVIGAFNDATNAINSIFEEEIGIRMNLIIIDSLIYLDPNMDPFTNANQGGSLLGQVIGAFQQEGVPVSSYDLGHILTGPCTDVGGVVSGRACNDGGKTRGVTCVGGSVVGAALRIMAHEIAHQFAVSHSWNNCPGSEGQRASNTSFEPGSGTTIMSYAGACGTQNIGNEQAYYHVGSVQQFLTYTRETGARDCATVVETDNFTPEVTLDYTDDFYIPVSTPFRLEGTATDSNDDDGSLAYNWEQYDLGPASTVTEPRGNAPLMRSVFPTPEGNVRYFPKLIDIVEGNTTRGERLPTYSRDMTFRLSARDRNVEAGGIDWEEIHFFTEETAGPFVVNEPAEEWSAGSFREVTWDVANTDQAPINCQRVNIVLSTDGGETFERVLAENVFNNGRAFVTVPQDVETEEARIMVEAADNIFLNVNQEDFLITEATVPGFTLEGDVRYEQVCLPYVFETDFVSGSVLGYDSTVQLTVEAVDLPAEANVNLSSSTLTPGETVTLTADLTDVRVSGLVEIVVVAVGPSLDTTRRRVFLDITDTDFNDLATMSPAEGTTGIILATQFDWTDAANADFYEIEIGTSPTFSPETIFERRTGIAGSEYLPDEFFLPNTLYFWRVRPSNLCGDGPWTRPNSFRTVNSSCNLYANEEPLNLPGSGPSFVRSTSIFVEDAGAISDINIPNIRVDYAFVSNVKLTLVSPAGTRVILYDERCFSTNTLNMGFDDDAPLPVVCPPDDQRVFTPVERLEAFIGEDTFGEWLLEVAVSETGGSAGSIVRWDVEFCADVTAVPPQSLNNDATEVPPLAGNTIISEKLRVNSTAFGTDEVKYTVTATPESGDLSLYGRVLMVGDTFFQSDINGLGLFYENTVAGVDSADFGFVVTTPDGGYLPIAYHDFMIFEGATVSNREVSALEEGLTVFPNPTGGDLSISWTTAINREINLELFDLTGRQLRSLRVNGAAKAAGMDIGNLPNGVYLLRVDGAVRRVVKQ